MFDTNDVTPVFTIAQLTGHATIQDLGREHVQHLGFSATGAADIHASAYANQQLNKPAGSPVIELALAEATLSPNVDLLCCVTGAECNLTVNEKAARQWQPLTLKAGDTLRISRPTKGNYVYIAASFEFSVPTFLGSCSPVPAGMSKELGIAPLKTGMQIPIQPLNMIESCQPRGCYAPLPTNFYQFEELVVRFIPSRFYRALSEEQQTLFLSQAYKITKDSNKMGYRLSGQAIFLSQENFQLLSRPTALGTIQINAEGLPIVLMKDRQTIGGYPVFGHIIQTDLYRLAQLTTNAKVQFKETSLSFAQQQLRMFNQRLGLSR